MTRSDSLINLAKALAKAQGELKPVKKETENPFFKSHYADLAAIIEEARPVLAANGLAVLQLPGATRPFVSDINPATGEVSQQLMAIDVMTLLLHVSGEFIAETLTMPYAVEKGAQAAGSAISYARRYGLQAMLGIAAEDDDANASSGRPKPPATKTAKDASKSLCPKHKVEFIHRVGTTKAGKDYDFWACPQKDGDKFCQEKPTAPAEATWAPAADAPDGQTPERIVEKFTQRKRLLLEYHNRGFLNKDDFTPPALDSKLAAKIAWLEDPKLIRALEEAAQQESE